MCNCTQFTEGAAVNNRSDAVLKALTEQFTCLFLVATVAAVIHLQLVMKEVLVAGWHTHKCFAWNVNIQICCLESLKHNLQRNKELSVWFSANTSLTFCANVKGVIGVKSFTCLLCVLLVLEAFRAFVHAQEWTSALLSVLSFIWADRSPAQKIQAVEPQWRNSAVS